MNLFHDGQRATKPSEYVLISPDLVLDLYQQANQRGYTQPHQAIHLRKILVDGFRRLVDISHYFIDGDLRYRRHSIISPPSGLGF